jgi:two-component system cell cycle sensor histidine kinase PleC
MTSLATAQSSTQATGFPTSVAQIRADRERVLSGAKAGPSLDYELLMLFVKNELLASLAMPALALVVAVALSYWAPASEILWWIGLVFISKGVLRLLCHRFKTQTPEDVDVARWRRDLAAAEFFNAMVWASVVFVTLKTDEAAPLFFIFGLTMVVVAVRMMFALTVTPVIHAGTIPLSAALVLRFLLTGDPFFWAMAAVTVGVHVCLLFLVTRMKRAVVAMMAFRAEKDALIAELEQAMAVSDEARVRAEDASAAKSKFLATMSHELRTPLNAILGFSEVMKVEMFGPMGNPTYKAYAADIHESGHHLLKLIDEVLDISRIEAGRYDLNEKPVHLPAILDDCHRLLRLRADGKGIRVVRAASVGR